MTTVYGKKLSHYIFNMNKPGRGITKSEMIHALKQTDCCNNVEGKFKIKQDGLKHKHLFTTDGRCISDSYAELFKKGAKFRLNLHNTDFLKTFMDLFKTNNENLLARLNSYNFV